jgi:hypothetical protein
VSQPPGIHPIGLVPLPTFDILGIGEAHYQATLQNIEYWLPVGTGDFFDLDTAQAHSVRVDRSHRLPRVV